MNEETVGEEGAGEVRRPEVTTPVALERICSEFGREEESGTEDTTAEDEETVRVERRAAEFEEGIAEVEELDPRFVGVARAVV